MFSKIEELTRSTKDNHLDWDEYFMSIALLASCRSPCERLHVGSVIVKDNRLISMGYNGFICGAPHISRIRGCHGNKETRLRSSVRRSPQYARLAETARRLLDGGVALPRAFAGGQLLTRVHADIRRTLPPKPFIGRILLWGISLALIAGVASVW